MFGLLICTSISENQGLKKSKSASNLRKNSGPANFWNSGNFWNLRTLVKFTIG